MQFIKITNKYRYIEQPVGYKENKKIILPTRVTLFIYTTIGVHKLTTYKTKICKGIFLCSLCSMFYVYLPVVPTVVLFTLFHVFIFFTSSLFVSLHTATNTTVATSPHFVTFAYTFSRWFVWINIWTST